MLHLIADYVTMIPLIGVNQHASRHQPIGWKSHKFPNDCFQCFNTVVILHLITPPTYSYGVLDTDNVQKANRKLHPNAH